MREVETASLPDGCEVVVWDPNAPHFTASDALGVALSGSDLETGPLTFFTSSSDESADADQSLEINELDLVVHAEHGLCLVGSSMDSADALTRAPLTRESIDARIRAFRHILDGIGLDVPLCSAFLLTWVGRDEVDAKLDLGETAVFFREDLPGLAAGLEHHMASNRRAASGCVPPLLELKERLGRWASLATEPAADRYDVPKWFWDESKRRVE